MACSRAAWARWLLLPPGAVAGPPDAAATSLKLRGLGSPGLWL
eukprot:CAMPEP_0202883310 /NCGR_PEP_ID=MMETSP1391-20130828/39270_1 /ASSEMBLY_ACC=CAM_ASM_000867 /TAXON_ID=1034604 /ORGANISM="Chlamydomonas leiostraca, Strain SAG 11-49" /LENGTH=42 /DNA_ID= /DNA_START= /DNA_END= /DNA_ORIENTATION=